MTMSKANDKPSDDEMRDHYDFSGGVRGKYAKKYAEGSNVVVLDPDVAEHFKTSEDVNPNPALRIIYISQVTLSPYLHVFVCFHRLHRHNGEEVRR